MNTEAARRGVDFTAVADPTSTTAQDVASPVQETHQGRTLDSLLNEYEVQSRSLAALHSDTEHGKEDTPDPQQRQGQPQWNAQHRAHTTRLDTLERQINEFGPEAHHRLDKYRTDNKAQHGDQPDSANEAGRSAGGQAGAHRDAVNRLGAYPTGLARAFPGAGKTTTTAGPVETTDHSTEATDHTPAYERSRTTDMLEVDPQQVQNRQAVAASFPHPIRTYTASGTTSTSRRANGTPARRHQLKRGK